MIFKSLSLNGTQLTIVLVLASFLCLTANQSSAEHVVEPPAFMSGNLSHIETVTQVPALPNADASSNSSRYTMTSQRMSLKIVDAKIFRYTNTSGQSVYEFLEGKWSYASTIKENLTFSSGGKSYISAPPNSGERTREWTGSGALTTSFTNGRFTFPRPNIGETVRLAMSGGRVTEVISESGKLPVTKVWEDHTLSGTIQGKIIPDGASSWAFDFNYHSRNLSPTSPSSGWAESSVLVSRTTTGIFGSSNSVPTAAAIVQSPTDTRTVIAGTDSPQWTTVGPIQIDLLAGGMAGINHIGFYAQNKSRDSESFGGVFSTPIRLSNEAHWTVFFKSVDELGKESPVGAADFWIDESPPEVTATFIGPALSQQSLRGNETVDIGTFSGPVKLHLSGSDVNGIKSTQYFAQHQTDASMSHGGVLHSEHTISGNGRWHVFFTAFDMAGRDAGVGLAMLTISTGSIGDIIPDEPYNLTSRSRSLVNGTVWKFNGRRSERTNIGSNDRIRWSIENPDGARLSHDGASWFPELVTTGPNVWFKSGQSNCRIHGEILDKHGSSLGRLEPALINVRHIPIYSQGSFGDIHNADHLLGLRSKKSVAGVLTIGPSRTIGALGCNLTAYAMLSSFFGSPVKPDALNRVFKELPVLGYLQGRYEMVPAPDGSKTDNWKFNASLHPSQVLDLDHDGVAGSTGDAWRNAAFVGDGLMNSSGFPIAYISSGEYTGQLTQVGSIKDAISDLRQEPPLPSLIHVRYVKSSIQKSAPHWLLAVGLTAINAAGDQDVIVNDPAMGKQYPFGQNSKGYSVVSRLRLKRSVPPISSQLMPYNIAVTTSCPAQILVEGADGCKVGVMPGGQFVDGIGNAWYELQDDEGIVSEYHPDFFWTQGAKSLTLAALHGPSRHKITVFGTGSGSYFSNVTLIDAQGEVQTLSMQGGHIDVGVRWSYDCAVGEDGILSAQLIPPTLRSIQADIEAFARDGEIIHRGIAHSLQQKLSNAEGARVRGNGNAWRNILESLIHEVDAQRGKHVSRLAANHLTFHIRYLLDER